MSFTLHVENLRALRRVEWAPEGVCALVGANGSGKSTLLQVLRFLNIAVGRGIDEAFRQTLGTSPGLRSRLASDDEDVGLSIDLDGARWRMPLRAIGTSILQPQETFEESAVGEPSGGWTASSPTPGRLALQEINGEPGMVELFRRFRIYHDPDLWSLRTNGSPSAEAVLYSRGQNAFSILRMWNERREHRFRHQFVLEGMRAAFPQICGDIDFETAGQTTFVRLWLPGSEVIAPIYNEANGVIAMLVYLCDIASSEPHGLTAIDEPENSLHPHAIRELVSSAQAWSEAYDTTIVLATHSPVILNALNSTPERVWVMRTDAGDEPNPTRLDQLKNPEWLRHFALGTLYANGELGSNEDAA